MSRECHQYNFNHKERGFAVLIVNKNFPKDSGMIKRRGWKKDMTRMKTFFKSLQFQVKCYKDLKGGAIMQKVYKACSDVKNKDADCFACVISTHGNEEPEKLRYGSMSKTVYQHCVYGSDGMPVFINDILDVVQEKKSPHLAGKPKLFFIQACRSRHDESKPKYDYGVLLRDKKSSRFSNDIEDTEDLHQKTCGQEENGNARGDHQITMMQEETRIAEPLSDDEWNSDDPDSDSESDYSDTGEETPDVEDPQASPDVHEPPPLPMDLVPISCPTDCLIMYPVTSGRVAFTNPRRGSYLLNYLYSKMDSLLEKRDLLPYLTEVVREVAKYDYNPEYKPKYLTVDEFHNCPFKMSACVVHRFTGDVVFNPKKDRSVIDVVKDAIRDKISHVA